MAELLKIKKRNGEIVDFKKAKIETAIAKAFLAVKGIGYEQTVQAISTQVMDRLDEIALQSEGFTPTVENVQDLVERGIMEAGFFDVAKSYILYRYEHEKIRVQEKEENIEKLERNELSVTKRSGKREKFSTEKLHKALSYAIAGFESIVDMGSLVEQVKLEVHDGMSTKDISRLLVMVTRSLIEQDPAYSSVASRLMLQTIYKEVIGGDTIDWKDIDTQYRKVFIANISRGVSIKRYDERLLSFDLDKLSSHLAIERDHLFMYLGIQTLYDRYFTRDIDDENNSIIETPQAFWMRVAMGLALLEKDKEAKAIEFYEVMSTLRFVPSTPTLFHSGTIRPQLSSCYLNTVGDSLESIFKSYSDNAQLSKYSGGIGTDWTAVRATGSVIRGTGVESNGTIPFLKIANDVTVCINRSGRRRGAACVYMECWHYDFEDFLELRKNTGDERRRAHDMNTAAWVPDLFMKRVREDGDWTLFSPDEVPDLHEIYGAKFEARYKEYEEEVKRGTIRIFKTMKARDIWKKMITMLFETGHPWVTFKDPSNIRSPQDHVGVVHNSNLCTEITLNNSATETAVCNLGSINLKTHVTAKGINKTLLESTTHTAMRMLDNVIDVNFYPTKEAETSNMLHRPVGLGIMGFQDALYVLDLPFDSEGAVKFSDESMEFVSYHAILESTNLAKERGAYSSFKGSKWDRDILPQDTIALLEKDRGETIDVPRTQTLNWTNVREAIKKYGMRNSNCMAIAPTATISNISDCIPTIEPIYKNIYVKSNASGDFTVVNPYLVDDLKKLSLWNFEMLGKLKFNDGRISAINEIPEHIREKYKEVFEIHPYWLIKAAAYRGRWIDQSQSLNIYFVGSSGKDLASVYDYAWSMGLKTTYYLRTMGASQVEKATLNIAEFGSTHKRPAVSSPMVASGATVSPIQMTDVEGRTAQVVKSDIPVATTQTVPVMASTAPAPTLKREYENVCESCQ